MPRSDGLTADLKVIYNSGFQITRERMARHITTGGSVEIREALIGSDNLNEDGQVNPGENVRFTLKLVNSGIQGFESVNIYPVEVVEKPLATTFRAENGF